jgi:proteasome lid subunit RPN8/RPN11/ketosteroid isomerase-like protein
MYDASSSQEIPTEYVIWQAPGAPQIAIRRRVMDGIHREVSEIFAAVPHRGAETGGILLGRREGGEIVVEDFEPVPTEHRFGPSYRLSDTDHQLLLETLDWFRGGAQPGLRVLGFYRSHTLPDFGLSDEDRELMRAHFPEPEDLVLLIKPSRTGACVADFFIRRHGRTDEAYVPMPFPFAGEAAAPPPAAAAESQPEPAPAVEQLASVRQPAAISWPSPHPRLAPEPDRPAGKRRWLWYAAAATLGLAGGALGYLSLHSDAGPPPEPARVAAAPARSEPPPAAADPAGDDSTSPATSDSAAIQALLDRWALALKRGDARAAAECYAPLVTAYYGRRNITRDAVQQSIRRSLKRFGGLDIYRISDLQITPVGDGRAVATFRKHWQTSGSRKFAGQEQDRMAMVRNQGAWQIASEQEQKRYRVGRPR